VLSARRDTLVALTLAVALTGLVAVAPVAQAKKAKVGGKVSITIPQFNPDTGQSLASGRVKAKLNCDGLRILRFAYFSADGTQTTQTITSVVTYPDGRFLVALTQPSSGTAPHTLRIFVEKRKTTFKGRKVNCKAITGAAPVPEPPSP
jgi:hypothetical protein